MKKKQTCFIILFLIVASCVAFGRIAGNDFITFDDPGFITENYHIQSGFNLESIKWAFSTTHESYWNPLTWISLMLDWSMFGANASFYHIVSLLLHIGAVIFLFLFLYKTTNNVWPAAFAAALFALHPLRVESVAWASERKDVLSMFFGMATLYVYAFYTEKRKLPRYLLCLILFALALMSKPMLITLPFVLMLLDYWPLERWQKAMDAPNKVFISAGRLICEKIPFIFLAIAASILAFWAQNKEGAVSSEAIMPFMTRATNAIVSYVTYLGKTFWPFNLAVFYPYDFFLPRWEIFISGIILILITAAVIYYIKKLPFLFAGWFWYMGTLIPVIGLIQVGSQAMADRYTYLPSIGIAIMLAWGIPFLFKQENIRRKILFPVGGAVIAILVFLTWQQCGYWKNGSELFGHALQVTKDNFLARHHFGLALYYEGKYKEAIVHYNRCISLEPNDAAFHHNRGLAYIKLGQHQKAIEDFNYAISLNSKYTDAYSNRGTVYFHTGNYRKAIADFNEAINLKKTEAGIYNRRGLAYAHLGKHQKANEDFNAVIHFRPDDADAFINRGITFANMGQNQLAFEDFNEAIRLKPDYANAYDNRGIAYLKQGNKKQGCLDVQKACTLGICKTLELAKGRGLCR